MKQYLSVPVKKICNKAAFLMASLLFSFYSFAQDKKVDIDITTKSEDKSVFMQPWVWVVGGAVFILLLIALLRNNKK